MFMNVLVYSVSYVRLFITFIMFIMFITFGMLNHDPRADGRAPHLTHSPSCYEN
jgi:hypothetical protein